MEFAAQAKAYLLDWSLPSRNRLRIKQLPPPGNWRWWLLMGGRGSGKTRAGASMVIREALKAQPGSVVLVIGRTHDDVRRDCFEGPAGIVQQLPASLIADWNVSVPLLTLKNDVRIRGLSADKPDSIRGKNIAFAWLDEFAAYRFGADVLYNLDMALRITPYRGGRPRAIVTTTPKPVGHVRDLMKRPDCVQVGQSTYDNAANIHPDTLASWTRKYAGTRIGKQELDGTFLEDVPGALWSWDTLTQAVAADRPQNLQRVVIGVDPAVSASEESDETGIVVCAEDETGYWVLADLSGQYSVSEWPHVVARAYNQYRGNLVVAEKNQGGDLVAEVLRHAAPDIALQTVWAKHGKALRAEPVAFLYQQGRVRHAQVFSDLTAQMAGFVPGQLAKSPDRVDALVYALTELSEPSAMVWSAAL